MVVLIVGLGSISAKHIIALRALEEDVIIYALRSTEGNNIDGIINIYDLKELDVSPYFVIISNPTQFHLETIASLLCLKVPMFIEKPPAHALVGVQTVINQINRQGIFTYVACNLRFHPCIQFLKSYLGKVGNKNINEVNVYCGSYLPDWRPGKDYKKIYSANKEMGGGVHLDLFHEMDYICWLFSYPDSSYGFKSNKSTLEIDAVDYANYILEYPGFNVSIILNYYRSKPKRTLEILFEKEILTIDLLNNNIYSDEKGMIFEKPAFKIIDTYKDQMKYFINCLTAGNNTMNTFEESIEILKVCLNDAKVKK